METTEYFFRLGVTHCKYGIKSDLLFIQNNGKLTLAYLFGWYSTKYCKNLNLEII